MEVALKDIEGAEANARQAAEVAGGTQGTSCAVGHMDARPLAPRNEPTQHHGGWGGEILAH